MDVMVYKWGLQGWFFQHKFSSFDLVFLSHALSPKIILKETQSISKLWERLCEDPDFVPFILPVSQQI